MKIAFIANGKLPVPASQGGAVETLIQILINNNEKNHKHDITVYTSYDAKSKEMSKKYKFTKFIFIETNDIEYKIGKVLRYIINRIPRIYIGNKFVNRLEKKIEFYREEYDYVIVENSPEYGLKLKKYFSQNLILHLHNDFLNKNKYLSYKILNSYKKIFTLSNYINSRVQEIDTSFKNIYTVYNGIDFEKFNRECNIDELRKKYNINEEDFVFLYTGRIVPEKGVKELILAFNKISNSNKLKLLIVGDISCKNNKNKKYINEIKNIAKLHSHNIIFAGYVDYENIQKYYYLANVGVIPSIWEEPFALTVIENLASGNPVIVSKSGGMPEIVNDKCAIIVNKDENYIDNLAKELVNIIEMARNDEVCNLARKQAEKFNSEKYVLKFNECLEKV